jgi:hypothetical protein
MLINTGLFIKTSRPTHSTYLSSSICTNIEEFVQPKMSLINKEFLIWKERGGGGGQRVSRQAYLRHI